MKNHDMKERIKTTGDKARKRTDSNSSKNSMIPPLLIILITTTPYQIRYTESYVGVVGISRREYKRNYVVR